MLGPSAQWMGNRAADRRRMQPLLPNCTHKVLNWTWLNTTTDNRQHRPSKTTTSSRAELERLREDRLKWRHQDRCTRQGPNLQPAANNPPPCCVDSTCEVRQRRRTNWTVSRFRISPLFMFFSCAGCALSRSMACLAAPHNQPCEKPSPLLVGLGWSNDERNMLFCFVRHELRTVQERYL